MQRSLLVGTSEEARPGVTGKGLNVEDKFSPKRPHASKWRYVAVGIIFQECLCDKKRSQEACQLEGRGPRYKWQGSDILSALGLRGNVADVFQGTHSLRVVAVSQPFPKLLGTSWKKHSASSFALQLACSKQSVNNDGCLCLICSRARDYRVYRCYLIFPLTNI